MNEEISAIFGGNADGDDTIFQPWD